MTKKQVLNLDYESQQKENKKLADELYSLFRDLDLFSAHTYEEFIDRLSDVSILERINLKEIIKLLKPKRPYSPPVDIPLSPAQEQIIEVAKKENEKIDNDVQFYYDDDETDLFTEQPTEQDNVDGVGGGGVAYEHMDEETPDKEEPFIVKFEPSWLENWNSDRIILPYNLMYYVRRYWPRFLKFMEDYYNIRDFEQFDTSEMLFLFLDTELIEIVSFNPDNPIHMLKMANLLQMIHTLIINEKGDQN